MKHISVFARLLALLLLFTLVFSLSACNTETPPSDTTDAASDSEATTGGGTSDALYDSTLPIKVTVLNGTTGFGMAKLMNNKANGTAALNYTFDVQADASNVTKALINGSTDIAALPTNAAATVYNKTNGAVQVLALNTLGVLYVVTRNALPENGGIEALRGKTVYCPANNPAIIFSAICEASGLKVGTDITIDTSYAEPAALRAALVKGDVNLAVLPEPMVTIAQKADTSISVAIDLTAAWDQKFPAGSLTQGCVVVRTEFAAAHPKEIAKFLEEYAASIAFMQEKPAEAAEIIVAEGVFAGAAAVAAAAIPKCNVTFKSGNEMKAALSIFLEALHSINPGSVGGNLPKDDFYYGAN